MKECRKCFIEKTDINFNKDNQNLDGLGSYCKECVKREVLRYSRTKKGMINKIYHAQKRNSIARGHTLPEYTKGELQDYMLSVDSFHDMYDGWVKSGFNPRYKPTIDRINECYGYCFSNIRIVTFQVNMNKPWHEDFKAERKLHKLK